MTFFDFEWSKDDLDRALRVQKQLGRADDVINEAVTGVLFAAVVTARGRRLSPSSILEQLMNSKKRTNPFIVEHINDAWNVMSDQAETTSDRVDVLTSLITPKHRNKTGISETLRYQLLQTYESFLDFWVTLADMMVGFRTMTKKVFGVGESTRLADYLHRGMTRSQLLASFGHELKPADDEPEEEGDE